ncbi:MAG: hypothetical protein R3F39_12550 [Myxococcota bacterium]
MRPIRFHRYVLALTLGLGAVLHAGACDPAETPVDIPNPDPGGDPGPIGTFPVTKVSTCPEQVAEDGADRLAVAKHYQASGQWWARFGFPPMARLASIREATGLSGLGAFSGALAHFDAEGFAFLAKVGELSPQLQKRLQVALGALPKAPLSERVVYVIRGLVDEGDAMAGGEIPPAWLMNAGLEAQLAEIYTAGFQALGTAVAPAAKKSCASATSTVLATAGTAPGSLDCSGAGNAKDPQCLQIAEPPVQDGQTTGGIGWEDITGVAWKTTYNPSCVMQSIGLCLHKLGKLADETVTCKLWNDFGKAVGGQPVRDAAGKPILDAKGKPKGGGAPRASIDAYMRGTHDLCPTTATNSATQSACQEADAAKTRGCDLIIYWRDHAEMVTGIAIDANKSGKCTVTTHSWGQSATVTYEDGKANNHSGANRFGDGAALKEANAAVSLVSYCPCD